MHELQLLWMYSPLPWHGHSTWTAAAVPVKRDQRAPCTLHLISGCPVLSQWPPGEHHITSGLDSATRCRGFAQPNSSHGSLSQILAGRNSPDLILKLKLSSAYIVPLEKGFNLARLFLPRQSIYFLQKNKSDLSPQSKQLTVFIPLSHSFVMA